MTRQVVLYSDDIGCEHCARTIEKALSGLAGVTTVRVDVDAKATHLEISDEAAIEAAKKLLAEIGYPARP